MAGSRSRIISRWKSANTRAGFLSKNAPRADKTSPRGAIRPLRPQLQVVWGPPYAIACLSAARTACSMALLVIVAPAMPSICGPCAASTCCAYVPSAMAS